MVKAANDTAMLKSVPTLAPVPRDAATEIVTRQNANDGAIDVTLSRETATFSMPARDGHLPASLQAALDRARGSVDLPAASTVAGTLNFEPTQVRTEPATVIAGTELTASDLALISRMAPQAAE